MLRSKLVNDGRPRRRGRVVWVGRCTTGLWPIAGRAEDKNWIGGNSTWDNPEGWNLPGVPANGDNATVGQSGATVTYQNANGNAITLGTLGVDSGGTLSQSKDFLKADFLQVGFSLTGGVYNLSGGSATVNQNFFIGNGPGSSGTFNLSASGVLNANGSTYIGGQGVGTFNQTGGTSNFGTNILGGLFMGYVKGSSASFTLSGGTVNVTNFGLGLSAASTFTQTGGTMNATLLGINAGGGVTSTYTLSGSGIVQTNQLTINNNGGIGVFTQNGGTNNVNGDTYLGVNSSVGEGIYNLNSGTLSTHKLAIGNGTKGTFNQTGGTLTASDLVTVGYYFNNPPAGRDVYTLSAGTLNAQAGLELDQSGVFNQTGGTLHTMLINLRYTASAKLSGGARDCTNLLIDLTGAKLDLTNQSMLINYDTSSPIDNVKTYVAHGYANGAWNGTGLNSSTAATSSSGAIGYGEASDVLSISGSQTKAWQGYTADATSVLVRYTLAGDANLDGKVDFQDLVRVAQNYGGLAGKYWPQGDFNYDGKTDFIDLVKLAQNYGGMLPVEAVPGAPAGFDQDLAAAFAQAPEPGTVGVLAGIAGVVMRRRRRS
jgi:hypothetical protein